MIRVILPAHLRTLAGVGGSVELEVEGVPTARSVVDAVERAYPMLRGTIRDQATKRRRAFVRYFASGRDVSHDADDSPLPEGVAQGRDPFMVVGAIAGG